MTRYVWLACGGWGSLYYLGARHIFWKLESDVVHPGPYSDGLLSHVDRLCSYSNSDTLFDTRFTVSYHVSPLSGLKRYSQESLVKIFPDDLLINLMLTDAIGIWKTKILLTTSCRKVSLS